MSGERKSAEQIAYELMMARQRMQAGEKTHYQEQWEKHAQSMAQQLPMILDTEIIDIADVWDAIKK